MTSMIYSEKLNHKRFTLVLLAYIAISCQSALLGQKPVTRNATLPPATTAQPQDQDTTTQYAGPKRNTFKMMFSGKPGKAALYSLLIPSGGQIYNKRWLKVPLALGVDGYFLYNLINKNKDYNYYNDIVSLYNQGGSHPEISQQSALNFRSAARTNREYAWVYLIVGHFVTVFDAYVDRHLLDFDISPDLTTALGPAAGISLKIPLNGEKKKVAQP